MDKEYRQVAKITVKLTKWNVELGKEIIKLNPVVHLLTIFKSKIILAKRYKKAYKYWTQTLNTYSILESRIL